jgi:surfactin synthase thioesterase subunit
MIARGESFGESEEEREVARHFVDQFGVRGHEADLCALVLSTMDESSCNFWPDHAAIGALRTPVHFCYARDDPEFACADVEAAIAMYARPNVVAYATGGHFFTAGKHAELAEHFVSFLRRELTDNGHHAPDEGRRQRSPPRSRRSGTAAASE